MNIKLVEHLRKLNEEDLFPNATPEEVKGREAEVERKKEERQKRKMELYKSINWRELEKVLTERLQTPITIKADLRQNDYVKWENQENLVEHVGIMQNVLEEVKIGSFGSSTLDDLAENNQYWCNINFSYSSFNGSNGLQIGTGWFNFETMTWTFRWQKEEHEEYLAKQGTRGGW